MAHFTHNDCRFFSSSASDFLHDELLERKFYLLAAFQMDCKFEVNIEKYGQKKVLREIIKIGETKSEVLSSDLSRFVQA